MEANAAEEIVEPVEDDEAAERAMFDALDGEVPNPEKVHRLSVVPATPVETLLMKLDAWLLQQPEFILLLNAPRTTRRKAAQRLAKHITTYPMRGMPFGGTV